MVKKKRAIASKRKKSNTRKNAEEAKRSKTEAPVSNVKNKLVSALKAMIDSMTEKHLYSVMAYVATVGKETETVSNAKPVQSTKGVPSAITTTTTEVNGSTASATTTTTTTGGTAPAVTTPNEALPPPPIQFNKDTRPPADTIVKIVPRCFNFGRTDRAADDLRRNKVQSLVNAIATNDMSLEQQALVLQQAVLHPLVRDILCQKCWTC